MVWKHKSVETYTLPHVLIQDSRYNILYKVYERLHSKEFNFNDDEKISLQWKRTDKLYEMWCYIKVCNILEDIGYSISSELENSSRSILNSMCQPKDFIFNPSKRRKTLSPMT